MADDEPVKTAILNGVVKNFVVKSCAFHHHFGELEYL